MIKQIIFKQPIADNTIRAILKNGSGVARMVVTPRPSPLCPYCHQEYDDMWYWTSRDGDDDMMDWWPSYESGVKPPYRPGDILYVRETWRVLKANRYDADAYIEFKAGGNGTVLRFPHGCTDSINRDNYDHFIEKWGVGGKWRPSIQMPREAARIFLRVTDVRAERLQDITVNDILREGVDVELPPICKKSMDPNFPTDKQRSSWEKMSSEQRDSYVENMARATYIGWCDYADRLFLRYKKIWNSTIKPDDLTLYGWDANPWVFANELELISREEAEHG